MKRNLKCVALALSFVSSLALAQDSVDSQLTAALKLDNPTASLVTVAKLNPGYASLTPAQQAELDFIWVEALDATKSQEGLALHFNRLATHLDALTIPDAGSKVLDDTELATSAALDDKTRIGFATAFIQALEPITGAKADLGDSYFQRALIYKQDIALIPEAVDDLQKGEDLARQASNDRVLLECEDLHSEVCTPIGDYRTTKLLGSDILSILAKENNPDYEKKYRARAESSLGRASHYLGDLAPAEEHHSAAVTLALQYGDLTTLEQSAMGLVLIQANERKFNEATKKINYFLQLATLTGNHSLELRLLIAKCYLQWRQTDYKGAKDTAEKMEAIDKALPAALHEEYISKMAVGCHCLAMIYLTPENETLAPSVLQDMKELNDWFKLWGDRSKDSIIASALYVRALIGAKQFPEAIRNGDDLLKRFEEVIDQVTDPADTGYYQQTVPHPYGHLAWVEHLQAQQDPARAESCNEAALAYSERGRGRGLQRQQVANVSNFTNLFTAGEQKQLSDEQTKLNLAYYRLHTAEADQKDNFAVHHAAVSKLQTQAGDEEQTKQHLMDQIFKNHDDAHLEVVQSQVVWSAIARRKLVREHPDTLYLSYSLVDEDRSMLIATSQAIGVQSFELPIGEQGWIDRATTWIENIKSDGRAPETAASDAELQEAKSLYKDLIGPLELAKVLDHDYKKVVIVAEGAIATIPFSALLDGKGQRFAQDYVISYTESLSLLTVGDTTDPPQKTFLCIADPNGNLPAADQEGKAIETLFEDRKMKQVDLLSGSEASASATKKLMPNFAIVHFACDGYMNSFYSSGNGLILSSKQSQNDAVLSGSEIMWLPMKAGLIVLSACETAVSEYDGGDGIQGLAWSFQAANCPTVIASRWKVDDSETSVLMVKFYEKLLAVGAVKATVAEALQQAEVSLIQSKSVRSKPYFWAAFDVFGKGDMDQTSLRLAG
ncbi:MAG TPA: CHAT domain-containing protein [Fimbriimonadaceae bacterium]|jgi:CHAT domain-containing protein